MPERAIFTSDFFFRQLFDDVSCTYSYLLADVVSKEALLIDPGKTLIIFMLHLKCWQHEICSSFGESWAWRGFD